ncbi:SgcJ/EcaC family oxidoreductase [Synechococcus sp. CS-1330]|nr:SgcJ/EcaC family oxidoreductase [Synechococcus sp. CS-1330]
MLNPLLRHFQTGLQLCALALALAVALLATPVQALEASAYPSAQQAPQAACSPLDERQVEGWFESWNQALATGDPVQVAQLYGDHALLLPTLSSELRETPEAITDYFNSFLARHPSGSVTHRQIRLGCNGAVDAGTYRFTLHDPEATVEARYTFVYGLEDGQWRILHHHSSLLPS